MNDHKPLVHPEDAKDQLAVSRTHIYNLAAAGLLCRHFIGVGQTDMRVCQPSVDKFLKDSAAPIPAA